MRKKGFLLLSSTQISISLDIRSKLQIPWVFFTLEENDTSKLIKSELPRPV